MRCLPRGCARPRSPARGCSGRRSRRRRSCAASTPISSRYAATIVVHRGIRQRVAPPGFVAIPAGARLLAEAALLAQPVGDRASTRHADSRRSGACGSASRCRCRRGRSCGTAPSPCRTFSSAPSTCCGDAPSSTRNIACRRYCSTIRLPMKPSHTPERPPSCRYASPAASPSPARRRPSASPRTTSSSFMTLAGLKKCMPRTSCGRLVPAAIRSTSSVDVLVARIAPGFAASSSVANTCSLIAMSSNTASMTRSASRRSS